MNNLIFTNKKKQCHSPIREGNGGGGGGWGVVV